LRKVYQWAEEQPLFPLFASEYVRKVLDFNHMAIAREGDRWLVRGDGELRTLRLPEGTGLPDMATSQGVAGYREDKPGRYLHLSGATASWQEGESARPYLQQANGRLTAFAQQDTGLQFSLRGYTELEFAIGNASGCVLTQAGLRLNPQRREEGVHYFRSAKHELVELRLQCSQ